MTKKPSDKFIIQPPETPNEFLPRPFLAVLFSLLAGKHKVIFDAEELNFFIEYYGFSEILLFEEYPTRKGLMLKFWASDKGKKVISRYLDKYLTQYRNKKLSYLELKAKREVKDPINALPLKESMKKTREILRKWRRSFGRDITVDFFKLDGIPAEVRFFEALWNLKQRKELILQNDRVRLTSSFVSRPPIEYKNLRISGRKILFHDVAIEITPTSDEFVLMKLLIGKRGSPITRERVYQQLKFTSKSKKASKASLDDYDYSGAYKKTKSRVAKRYENRLRDTIKRIYKKFNACSIKLLIVNTQVDGVFIKSAEFDKAKRHNS